MSKPDNEDRRILRTTATPQQAWDAWAKPENIAQWFADKAHGEAVAGGTITHVFEKFGMELPHKVIEAVPGERLVLEGMGPGGLPFRQQVLVRRDGGETVIELVHSGFDDAADWGDEYEGMDSGWKMALAILKHYLENHFGRPRRTYFVMRPAAYENDQLDGAFRSEAGLGQWLTSAGSIGEVGSPVALQLQHGASLTGEVLAWTGLETAVSWAEVRGVVELKAFSMGPRGKAIALRAASWADEPPPTEEVEAWMTAALDRLATTLG